MSCKKIQAKFGLYKDLLLSEKEHKNLDKHFQNCKECKKEYEKFIIIFNNTHLIKDISLPNYLKDKILDNVKQKNIDNKKIFKSKRLKYSKNFYYLVPITIFFFFLLFNNSKNLNKINNIQFQEKTVSAERARTISPTPIILDEKLSVKLNVPNEHKEYVKNIIKENTNNIIKEKNKYLKVYLNIFEIENIFETLKQEKITINNLEKIENNINELNKIENLELNKYIQFKFYF